MVLISIPGNLCSAVAKDNLPKTKSTKQEDNDRRLAGLPSVEVSNLQVQLANAISERDDARKERDEAVLLAERVEAQQIRDAETIASLRETMEEASADFAAQLKKEREERSEAGIRHEEEVSNAKLEAETLRRRVSEVATERDIISNDRSSTNQSLTTKLEDEKQRTKRLSENLQTSERIGVRLREEISSLKSEANEMKRKLSTTEQNLAMATGSLQKNQDGMEQHLRNKDQLIEELKGELETLKEELLTERAIAIEMAEQRSAKRVSQALEEAKKKEADAMSLLRDQLHAESSELRRPLEQALHEAREEADRWKSKLAECDRVRQNLENNVDEETKQIEALKAELSTLRGEMEKQKNHMSGDELRERLESLKEVVSHTLKEKAGLEEELVRLREVMASQGNATGVVEELQGRLQTVKEMNSRLDSDNEDLRMRLHTAHSTLKQHHISLKDAAVSLGKVELGNQGSQRPSTGPKRSARTPVVARSGALPRSRSVSRQRGR